MYICPNCKKTSEVQMNFCSQCGVPMIKEEPAPVVESAPAVEPAPVAEPTPVVEPAPEVPAPEAPAQPTYQPPVYTQPAYTQAPYIPHEEKKPVHLAKKIVGMALSIGGLVFAALGLLYTLMFVAIEGAAAFVFALVFSIFSAPLSIIGLVMSIGNINNGDTSTMSRVGKNLGIVGIILTGVMLFIGIIAIATYDPYYYY